MWTLIFSNFVAFTYPGIKNLFDHFVELLEFFGTIPYLASLISSAEAKTNRCLGISSFCHCLGFSSFCSLRESLRLFAVDSGVLSSNFGFTVFIS